MTGANRANRAIRACQRAGLPVVSQHECTCRLGGRLVIVAQPGRVEIVWPFHYPCPIHDRAAGHAPCRGELAARSQGYHDGADPIGELASQPFTRELMALPGCAAVGTRTVKFELLVERGNDAA